MIALLVNRTVIIYFSKCSMAKKKISYHFYVTDPMQTTELNAMLFNDMRSLVIVYHCLAPDQIGLAVFSIGLSENFRPQGDYYFMVPPGLFWGLICVCVGNESRAFFVNFKPLLAQISFSLWSVSRHCCLVGAYPY